MSEKPIYALSVRQPWAWLLLQNDMKDVENRDWHLKDRRFVPVDLVFPARIYIHASKSKAELNNGTFDFIRDILGHGLEWKADFGAIIGETTVTHYTLSSKSPWFTGKYGFVRENPILYDNPIPCKGQLGFWKVPKEIIYNDQADEYLRLEDEHLKNYFESQLEANND